MMIRALAVDYDGTIAANGHVAEATAAALARVRQSGRRVVLVTGRMLPDLRLICPAVNSMFDAVVVENGAVVHLPPDSRTAVLGPPPEAALVTALLRHRVIHRLGDSIVATTTDFADGARAAIGEAGVARVLEFNKESLMLVPTGITKGTGLKAALDALGILPEQAVAVGDAENDEALFAACGRAVAVADAVPALRARAHHVTRAPGGRGVVEFVDEELLKRA